MSRFAKELVKAAKSQIGIHEVGGNNIGPMIKKYQATTWLTPGPWPWCAAFVSWCVKNALYYKDVWDEFGITNLREMSNFRPKLALAYAFETWGKENGFEILDETHEAKLGDIVTFDFSHIGIVIADQTGNYITTIEGNTNVKGQRDSESGDGVYVKRRHKSSIRSLIRKSV